MNPPQKGFSKISVALRKQTNFRKNWNFLRNAHPKKSFLVYKRPILAEILGWKGFILGKMLDAPPPLEDPPRPSRSGQNFQKTATFRTSRLPKKGFILRSPLFVGGFICKALRSTTEFFIKCEGSFLGKHPVYIYML